jgi:predicted DNA-binding transcriptional regulator AlpA
VSLNVELPISEYPNDSEPPVTRLYREVVGKSPSVPEVGRIKVDELWLCRRCADAQGVQFKYPPSPWAYCAQAGCALTPEEQLVALARWQHERPPSPSASAAGAGRPTEPVVAERELMTIPAVAALLGRSVKGTYRLAAARGLPGAIKVGGKWVVRRSELLRSEAEGRVSPGRTRR